MERVVVRLLPVVVAVMAACGGGGAEKLSREEYLRRADEICRRGQLELTEASKDAFAGIGEEEAPTEEQIEAYARETVVPMVRRQVEELRDLPPPEGGAGEVDAIYDAIEAALDRVEEDPGLLQREGTAVFAEADELSREHGYPVCTGG